MNDSSRMTLRKMVALGTGWFGILFFWAFYTGTMPLFLRQFTDSKFIISLVLTLAGVSGCIVPPIVGFLSDRTITRFGRRRPYVIVGMFGMFVCLLLLPHLQLFGMVVIISAFLYFFVDIAHTPFMSLLADLTPARQRGTASGMMNLFGNIGLIGCFLLSSRLWSNYRLLLFYLVAFISAGCTIGSLLPLKEFHPSERAPFKAIGPFDYLRSFAKEEKAMKFFLAQFFWWLGFWVVQSFLTLFIVEYLMVSERKALLVPMAATVVQACMVLPLGILGDRIGRKRLLASMVALWAGVQFFIGFSQNSMQVFLLVAITGIPLAAVTGIGYAFMLDLIPPARTAEFVGIGIISMAAPQIFGPLIGGALIDSLGYRFIFPAAAVFLFIAFLLTRSIGTTERRKSVRPVGIEP